MRGHRNIMNILRDKKGIALPMTLMVIIVLFALGSIFVLRTMHEWGAVQRERRLTQSFYIAEGGAEAGLDALDGLINTDLLNTITASNPQVVINLTQSYVTAQDGLGFLVYAVRHNNVQQFTLSGSEALYSMGPVGLGAGQYSLDLIVTEKEDPHVSGLDQWDFPYYYRVQATGTADGSRRKVLLAGDFTVRVQRDNFAKYALFTNEQSMPSGTRVWFTDKTNFAGPIHTNDRFNFALDPSGIFDGIATQHEDDARFYNEGWPVLLDADHNGTRDVPTFNAGFTRGADEIVLSSSVQKQDMIDQAKGGTSPLGAGIFIPNDGAQLTGGIYVNGDASIDMSVNASNNAVYTINQSGVTKVITVDKAGNQTSVETVGYGTDTYNGVPDGMDDVGTIIFVDGNVSSLKGTVQEATELTIASENDLSITGSVQYSNFTPASGNPGDAAYVAPTANGATNLLGLVTWNGDVRVATSAPDDIQIHASILAQNGIFAVDDYNNQTAGPRGTATLLGGVISDNYGAFGLFNGTTGQQLSGYGRNFVYDDRMLVGTSPPYFPSLQTFIAFTNDIIDKITLQEGGF